MGITSVFTLSSSGRGAVDWGSESTKCSMVESACKSVPCLSIHCMIVIVHLKLNHKFISLIGLINFDLNGTLTVILDSSSHML